MKTITILAAAGLLASVGLTACGGKDDTAKAPAKNQNARAVRTVLVEQRSIEGGLVASGQLLSREEAAVTAEVTGYRVAKVMADLGDVVREGQPLVQLDDTLLRSQIDQQTALLAQAEVAARQAQAQAARVAGLDNSGALPQEQIEQRRFSAESTRAAAQAQAAQLKDLQTRAAKMTVRAPVGGTILERTVRPGDLSAAGANPMFRIARGSLVELAAQVPESSLKDIRPGQAAMIILPDATRVQGTVRIVSPSVNQQTHLGEVRVSLPVRADLRPGGYGSAAFGDSGKASIAVPEAALHYDADGVSVMTVDAANKVGEMKVKTGRRGSGYVELLVGPPAGTQVLLGASSFVLAGDVVKPQLVSGQAAATVPPTASAAPAPAKAPAK